MSGAFGLCYNTEILCPSLPMAVAVSPVALALLQQGTHFTLKGPDGASGLIILKVDLGGSSIVVQATSFLSLCQFGISALDGMFKKKLLKCYLNFLSPPQCFPLS